MRSRRGPESDLPNSLAEGELGLSIDTGNVYIGAPNVSAISSRTAAPYQNLKLLTELDLASFDASEVKTVTGQSPVNGDVSLSALVTGGIWTSSALTGNPTAPTPSSGDNSTAIATTAFVTAQTTPYGSQPTQTQNLSTVNTITDSNIIWYFNVDTTANITINITDDESNAKILTVFLIGDGSHTATFVTSSSSLEWDQGTVPTMNTASGKTTIFSFVRYPGQGIWFGRRLVLQA